MNFTCKPIKSKKKINEILNFAKSKNLRVECMIRLQLNLGLRISDIVGLKVSDLHGDYLNLTETKTGKIQKIKLNKKIKDYIEDYVSSKGLTHTDYLLPSRVIGRPITTRTAQNDLQHIAKVLQLDEFSTHSLRKTFGYWAYKQSKFNIALLMRRFNHSSQAITLRYIGIEQEELDDLADLVQF